ncbi:MAG: Thivi_2564 family membrane protein [Candidatus Sulfotelmatobacter sp.]
MRSRLGEATTSSQTAFFIRVPAPNLRWTRFDPSFSKLKIGGTPPADERRRPQKKKGTKIMPLIQLLEVLIVVGVLLWLVNRFIPMQSSIKSILNGVVVIAVVLWLLNVFGMFHSLSHIRVGT